MILHSSPPSSSIPINIMCSSHKNELKIARERPTLCSCGCGRRHFIEAATASALLPLKPSTSSELPSDYMYMLKRVHPPRPDWYEEFYASVMNSSMDSYEAEIAGYKSQIFGNLRGNSEKVLEIGIGTGPNLKYYACDPNIQVFGVDPNKKMEKYAQAAAVAAGLPLTNFKFLQAVCVLISNVA
ncbi:hypothetical protein Patl1_15968 [Pistacia atlantica]|uniref:Uncharacterized protein n=1 Tax=Pistacia atlantica TaxID=434234 RepID=A0ACC1B8H8_9ROSI|nr:hypothetical protein Patl1_15968 [Pistacia atlantica]